MAFVTLYVTAQGVAVVEKGKRRWVDVHWFYGNSYFRIGLDWIEFALLDGWQLIKQVLFSSNTDLEPAMAPRIQHEKRSYQLEFQLFTA
ncbi:MAG: transposase [Cyanobacteria bacterium J06581_3]